MGWQRVGHDVVIEQIQSKETDSMKDRLTNLFFGCSGCLLNIHLPFFPQKLILSWQQRVRLSSVQFSHSVMSDSLRPHGLQHARPPCPSPTPRVYSNSGPLSQRCHPTISSSIGPFSSCLQCFPASGSFPMSWLFTSGDQNIGASASV